MLSTVTLIPWFPKERPPALPRSYGVLRLLQWRVDSPGG
jgi:hypothetical protein